MTRYFYPLLLIVVFSSCKNNESIADATGTFEAEEVVVSSEVAGRIVSFNVKEGQHIAGDSAVGMIDAKGITLQREQVEATIESLNQKTLDAFPQVRLLEQQRTVQQSRLTNLQHERTRVENLVKADAATRKQLDDIDAQIDIVQKEMNVVQQQIAVQKSNINSQNRGILSESEPLRKRIAQLDDQVERATIVNPVSGTVITKYAEAGEITAAGRALYKIADLSTLNLRAYITGEQLPSLKLQQPVKILIDQQDGKSKEYQGVITWISDKAEFTPKTIQTKEERANLVYAIKVNVRNDGYLKIGMYGEVLFSDSASK
ncbi:MAG: HlyD family efflux transporter periplasmic adaptor subunit [Chitinophagaceae bacterium]|nr:HlyD family efflux transporter periplasmic adaptor subunit [Chitinophagaceae bacterium]